MNRFIAVLSFVIEGYGAKPKYEEQLRFIEAVDLNHAMIKAKRIGQNEVCIIKQSNGNSLEWRFLAVTELSELQNNNDGAELFYRITELDALNEKLEEVKVKAELLKLRVPTEVIV